MLFFYVLQVIDILIKNGADVNIKNVSLLMFLWGAFNNLCHSFTPSLKVIPSSMETSLSPELYLL